MAKMECYVLMNIDTTQSLGLLSAVIWQKEGIRMYEIEGHGMLSFITQELSIT